MLLLAVFSAAKLRAKARSDGKGGALFLRVSREKPNGCHAKHGLEELRMLARPDRLFYELLIVPNQNHW